MQINFVSLFDAIRAIAPRVEISEQEVGFYSDTLGEDESFEQMLTRAPTRQCFQNSRAATKLLNYLFNTSASLRWLDIALTGFPLQSDDARKEGRDELVRLARQEQEYKTNFERVRRYSPRWRDSTTDNESQTSAFLDPPKLPRSCDIGFDQVELTIFLNKNNIPHNLGNLPPSTKEETEGSAIVQPLAVNIPKQAELSRSNRKKSRQFRGPEAEILKMAEEQARDPDDYKSVWAALVKIARGEKPPYPIIGYVSDEEGIKMHDENLLDTVRFFTKEGMRKRIR